MVEHDNTRVANCRLNARIRNYTQIGHGISVWFGMLRSSVPDLVKPATSNVNITQFAPKPTPKRIRFIYQREHSKFADSKALITHDKRSTRAKTRITRAFNINHNSTAYYIIYDDSSHLGIPWKTPLTTHPNTAHAHAHSAQVRTAQSRFTETKL